LAIRIFFSTGANVGGVSHTPGIDEPDGPDPGHVRHRSWLVTTVAETGSTNDDLLRAATRGGLPDRSVLRTDHQTAGRGRLDRRWDAPPGSNLLASVFFADPQGHPTELLQRVGAAIVRAVRSLHANDVDHASSSAMAPARASPEQLATLGLKWPNDVLFDGRKLAGVLALRLSTVAGGLVVGFGVNVGWAPPEGARTEEICRAQPAVLLLSILDAFDALPADREVFGEIYRHELLTLGQQVRVHLPLEETFDGVAHATDVHGRIMVRSVSGVERVFDVGDVVHLRPGN